MLKGAIEDGQLIHKNGTEDEAAGSGQAFGRNWAMNIEDGFEMLIEVLNCNGTSFVQDFTHFHTSIAMRIRIVLARMRSDQHTTSLLTEALKSLVKVMLIDEQEAQILGQFSNQRRGLLIVCRIGSGKICSQRQPSAIGHRNDGMKFPAVDPAMITGVRPMGLCVNRDDRIISTP